MCNESKKRRTKSLYASLMLIFLCYVAFFLSKDICEYARLGVKLCIECIIPTIFPFLILTDFYLAHGESERLVLIKRCLSNLFRIEECGADAIICGWLTGFPVGVKEATRLYKNRNIKKENAELISAISTIPSPAFTVASTTVLLGSVAHGIIAVSCIYLSAAVVGLFFRQKEKIYYNTTYISRQNFNFVDSVKNAGFNIITISSFIIFFSAVVGLVKKYIKSNLLLNILLPLLELANAVDFITQNVNDYSPISLGFTFGFGGMSVIMQSASFLKEADLSVKRQIYIKLWHGVICAIITHLAFLIIPI